MSELLKKALEEGWRIKDVMHPYVYKKDVNFHVSRELGELFKERKLIIVEKDGKLEIISSD